MLQIGGTELDSLGFRKTRLSGMVPHANCRASTSVWSSLFGTWSVAYILEKVVNVTFISLMLKVVDFFTSVMIKWLFGAYFWFLIFINCESST